MLTRNGWDKPPSSLENRMTGTLRADGSQGHAIRIPLYLGFGADDSGLIEEVPRHSGTIVLRGVEYRYP